MDKICSIEEIQKLIQEVKSNHKGFLTNFYVDIYRHTLWIDKNLLFYESYGDCVLLFRKHDTFITLFFISTDLHALDVALSQFMAQRQQLPVVVDVVGDGKNMEVKRRFEFAGFELYESLFRMSRVGEASSYNDNEVTLACKNDICAIKELLYSQFNPLSEQLPEVEEIETFVEKGCILVCKRNENLLGFIIYELIGVTLYLRYWFVAPDYRNLKIGSKLFNAFMSIGKSTKRQILWVISHNENAIKRYQHYGFKMENMFDYVLLKK